MAPHAAVPNKQVTPTTSWKGSTRSPPNCRCSTSAQFCLYASRFCWNCCSTGEPGAPAGITIRKAPVDLRDSET